MTDLRKEPCPDTNGLIHGMENLVTCAGNLVKAWDGWEGESIPWECIVCVEGHPKGYSTASSRSQRCLIM